MRPRRTLRAVVAAGLAVAAAVAFFVSPLASSDPDGLERVALDEGFATEADEHALEGSPTADYALRGVDDESLSTGLAGLLGVGVTFAVTGGLLAVVRRRGRARAAPA